MITLKMTIMTPDGNKVKLSVPVQIDEESLKRFGEHTIVPLSGIEDAVLSID